MVKRRVKRLSRPPIEVRGAERGPTVRNVFVWSLGLVIIAMAVVWFVYFRTRIVKPKGRSLIMAKQSPDHGITPSMTRRKSSLR